MFNRWSCSIRILYHIYIYYYIVIRFRCANAEECEINSQLWQAIHANPWMIYIYPDRKKFYPTSDYHIEYENFINRRAGLNRLHTIFRISLTPLHIWRPSNSYKGALVGTFFTFCCSMYFINFKANLHVKEENCTLLRSCVIFQDILSSIIKGIYVNSFTQLIVGT